MTDLPAEELLLGYLTGKLSDEERARVHATLEKTTRGRAVGIGLRQVMAAEILERGSPDARESLARLLERLDGRASERQNVGRETLLGQAKLTPETHPFKKNRQGKIFKERPGPDGIFKRGTLRSKEALLEAGDLERTVHLSRMHGHGRGARTLWGNVQWVVSASALVALLVITWVTVSRRQVSDAKNSVITYMTAKGERATILLPDSSRITLNVASRIDIPRHFGEHNRIVHLQGEADFQVAHTTGTPFTVEAAGRHIAVLGTEFGVRAYQLEDVQVAVRSGRVAVDHTVLAENDVAHVSTNGPVFVAHQRSLDAAFGFMTGQLVMRNRPLRDAIDDLDRWYDVDLRLGDLSLGDIRFDAVLTSGSVGHLILVLSNTLDVRIVRDGRTLTLYPR